MVANRNAVKRNLTCRTVLAYSLLYTVRCLLSATCTGEAGHSSAQEICVSFWRSSTDCFVRSVVALM